MEVILLLLLMVAFGFVTGGVAKRYGRDAAGWGIFGALLFIVALPLLFFLGPSTPSRSRRRAGTRNRVQVVRRRGNRPHLP